MYYFSIYNLKKYNICVTKRNDDVTLMFHLFTGLYVCGRLQSLVRMLILDWQFQHLFKCMKTHLC